MTKEEIENKIRSIFISHIHDPAWFTLMQQPIIDFCLKVRNETLEEAAKEVHKLWDDEYAGLEMAEEAIRALKEDKK